MSLVYPTETLNVSHRCTWLGGMSSEEEAGVSRAEGNVLDSPFSPEQLAWLDCVFEAQSGTCSQAAQAGTTLVSSLHGGSGLCDSHLYTR